MWLKTLKNTVFLAKILRKNRSAISIAIFGASGCSPQLRVFTLVALRVFTQKFCGLEAVACQLPIHGFPCFFPYPCLGSGSYSPARHPPRTRQLSRPSICIKCGSYPRPGCAPESTSHPWQLLPARRPVASPCPRTSCPAATPNPAADPARQLPRIRRPPISSYPGTTAAADPAAAPGPGAGPGPGATPAVPSPAGALGAAAARCARSSSQH